VAATPTPLCGADAAGARARMRRPPGGAGRITRLVARLAGILAAAGVLLAVARISSRMKIASSATAGWVR